MLRTFVVFTAVAVFALLSSALAVCTVSAPRSQTFDAEGVDTIRLEAGAGHLNVTGDGDVETIAIDGMACGSSASLLERVRIDVERDGATLVVTALPEAGFLLSARLDVDVGLPERMRVEIDDRSGDLSIIDVGGDVTIAEDASGNIEIRQVRGSVAILDDGSGDITVEAVGGDLTVDEAGSGAVRHSSVEGDVRVPRD